MEYLSTVIRTRLRRSTPVPRVSWPISDTGSWSATISMPRWTISMCVTWCRPRRRGRRRPRQRRGYIRLREQLCRPGRLPTYRGPSQWALEIRRELVTGDPTDVQFDHLSREYSFGRGEADIRALGRPKCCATFHRQSLRSLSPPSARSFWPAAVWSLGASPEPTLAPTYAEAAPS